MFSTNKSGRRAGVFGLAVGCGVAVWLAGWAFAGPARTPPPANPAQPAATPGLTPAGPFGSLSGPFGNTIGGRSGLAPADAKEQAETLRKRYPFESVAGRLDYEPAGAAAFAKSEPAPQVTAETLKRLAGVEKLMTQSERWNPRAQSLKLLHEAQAEKFMAQDGFGLDRMPTPPSPSPRLLELAVAPTLPFEAPRQGAAAGAKGTNAPPAGAAAFPKDADLTALGERGLLAFANPIGFGYVKDREHVAGFQPHQFREMPALYAGDGATKTEKWAVLRLELVSLLKHEQPVVYVTRALPRMEDVAGAPTRPLIPFEEKGLKALKAGDDLATETLGDRIRMVGSLRAGRQCLDCHQVKRGDLLGAFSWELHRQPVADEKTP